MNWLEMMRKDLPARHAAPAIRVETVRMVPVPDPLAWSKGFVCGFVAAALAAAGLAALLWRF